MTARCLRSTTKSSHVPCPRAVGRYVVWLSLPRVLSRGGMHAGAGPLIVLPSKTEVSRGARVPRVPPRPRAGLLSKTMQLPRVGAVLDFQHRVGSRPLGAHMTQSDRSPRWFLLRQSSCASRGPPYCGGRGAARRARCRVATFVCRRGPVRRGGGAEVFPRPRFPLPVPAWRRPMRTPAPTPLASVGVRTSAISGCG